MAQYLTDLRKRRAGGHHRGCGRVTQLPGRHMAQPHPCGHPSHRAAHPGHRQRLVRGADPDEHRAGVDAGRAATAKIPRHGFAHIGGQRHSLDPVALASDDQFPSTPINIVEA